MYLLLLIENSTCTYHIIYIRAIRNKTQFIIELFIIIIHMKVTGIATRTATAAVAIASKITTASSLSSSSSSSTHSGTAEQAIPPQQTLPINGVRGSGHRKNVVDGSNRHEQTKSEEYVSNNNNKKTKMKTILKRIHDDTTVVLDEKMKLKNTKHRVPSASEREEGESFRQVHQYGSSKNTAVNKIMQRLAKQNERDHELSSSLSHHRHDFHTNPDRENHTDLGIIAATGQNGNSNRGKDQRKSRRRLVRQQHRVLKDDDADDTNQNTLPVSSSSYYSSSTSPDFFNYDTEPSFRADKLFTISDESTVLIRDFPDEDNVTSEGHSRNGEKQDEDEDEDEDEDDVDRPVSHHRNGTETNFMIPSLHYICEQQQQRTATTTTSRTYDKFKHGSDDKSEDSSDDKSGDDCDEGRENIASSSSSFCDCSNFDFEKTAGIIECGTRRGADETLMTNQEGDIIDYGYCSKTMNHCEEDVEICYRETIHLEAFGPGDYYYKSCTAYLKPYQQHVCTTFTSSSAAASQRTWFGKVSDDNDDDEVVASSSEDDIKYYEESCKVTFNNEKCKSCEVEIRQYENIIFNEMTNQYEISSDAYENRCFQIDCSNDNNTFLGANQNRDMHILNTCDRPIPTIKYNVVFGDDCERCPPCGLGYYMTPKNSTNRLTGKFPVIGEYKCTGMELGAMAGYFDRKECQEIQTNTEKYCDCKPIFFDPSLLLVLANNKDGGCSKSSRTNKPTNNPTHSEEPSDYPTQSESPSELPTQSNEPSEFPTKSEEPSDNPTQSEEPSEFPTQNEEPSEEPSESYPPSRKVLSDKASTEKPTPKPTPFFPIPPSWITRKPTRNKPTKAPTTLEPSFEPSPPPMITLPGDTIGGSICLVCGSNYQTVDNPGTLVDLPNGVKSTCASLEAAGRLGLFTSGYCEEIAKPFIFNECGGCKNISNNTGSDDASSRTVSTIGGLPEDFVEHNKNDEHTDDSVRDRYNNRRNENSIYLRDHNNNTTTNNKRSVEEIFSPLARSTIIDEGNNNDTVHAPISPVEDISCHSHEDCKENEEYCAYNNLCVSLALISGNDESEMDDEFWELSTLWSRAGNESLITDDGKLQIFVNDTLDHVARDDNDDVAVTSEKENMVVDSNETIFESELILMDEILGNESLLVSDDDFNNVTSSSDAQQSSATDDDIIVQLLIDEAINLARDNDDGIATGRAGDLSYTVSDDDFNNVTSSSDAQQLSATDDDTVVQLLIDEAINLARDDYDGIATGRAGDLSYSEGEGKSGSPKFYREVPEETNAGDNVDEKDNNINSSSSSSSSNNINNINNKSNTAESPCTIMTSSSSLMMAISTVLFAIIQW